MNWLLLGLVWLAASLAFSLGWAAVMRAERRYCVYCSDPHHAHQPHPGADHVHVWNVTRQRRIVP